ncbi:L-rhamnose mutarotase [Parabacteroides sp. APC149_11_2_Y6]
MERLAFKMSLKSGAEAEYERRHKEIWPELAALLRKNGVSDYSIFLDKTTSTLFAVQQINGSGSSQDLGDNEIVQKWWAYMAELMETNEDQSPVSVPLKEVFHMD